MKISVVIPAYNEEETIKETISSIRRHSAGHIKEIIVVDGGSEDATVERVQETEACLVTSPAKGRSVQMNYGAEVATGDILYFLHADTIPPKNFDSNILKSVTNGAKAGCFQLSFDRDHPLLDFYAWCTRFNIDAFRFGDQSLFVSAETFASIGGFREDHIVMEDQELMKRLKKKFSFDLLSDAVLTSSRKYSDNGVLKLQLVFTLIFMLYQVGVSQTNLDLIYKKLIH
ncbi:glycosyltransferase [Balneolaceae bacterium YR4-1]|uniref:Glycosyltransferase n=1 Tax=Halalkalibaculum roseum TaxID=2709311 RepID=A0A6M1TBT5_9BACT|nr:TIGR04283 family arsenosugar biosynthesis glycosyltransferase [Halalkalibaculum roseum]NGP77573.1 glycosyltransferase [Halalkalibaculum roseum]